uniref:phospholipase A2 n=1 Tax=Ampulex compressa TaxID=860918 RepID=A0A1W6EVZ3_AMPCP|nr:venom protein [Ampulex compressa]
MLWNPIGIYEIVVYLFVALPYNLGNALTVDELYDLSLSTRILVETGAVRWCFSSKGPRDQTELGLLHIIDSCCKSVVLCDDVIDTRQYKYGIYNNGSHTRRNCECDSMFYNCLKNVDDGTKLIAFAIKTMYHVRSPLCFFKLHDVDCINKYYDEKNNTYIHSGGGKYFCAKWYVSKFE